MDQYSWMREAFEDSTAGAGGEGEGQQHRRTNVGNGNEDEERFSELIADTVGGRTRAQLAEHQQQQGTTPTSAMCPDERCNYIGVDQSALKSHLRTHSNGGNRTPHRSQQPQQQQSQPHSSPIVNNRSKQTPLTATPLKAGVDKATSIMSLAGDSDIQRFRRQIEEHPRPGEGAQRLFELVRQPFRAKFGTDERVPSSAREIEQQRAASSTKPLISPFETEPDLILHDSPRREDRSEEEHPPVFDEDESPYHRHRQQQQQQTSTRTKKRSTSTQTHHHTEGLQNEQHHNRQQHQPERDRLFGRSGGRRNSSISTDDNHRSGGHQQHSPPSLGNYSPLPHPTPYRRRHSSLARRPKSLSDYPPLYDFSRRPQIRPSINVDAHSLDPNHYRRRFIESLVSDIRRNKETVRKLEGRKTELDDACQRDAEELNFYRRERELLVRELELQSREKDLAERERRCASSLSVPPLSPHPILKHSSSFPPFPSTGGTTPNGNNGSNRVNFASPICTAKEYTPNNSSVSANGVQTADRHCKHPLHLRQKTPLPTTTLAKDTAARRTQNNRQQSQHRVVLENRTNSDRRQPFLPSSPTLPRSPSPRDVAVDRENESRRVAYETEFRATQQRVKAAAAAQRYRNRGGHHVPILRHTYNPTNPTSVFQFIPLNR